MHKLHLLPSLLGELLHIGNNLHLAIDHEQGVIQVGDGRDDVGLYYRLIILSSDELHLSRALSTEQIAEKIDIPTG